MIRKIGILFTAASSVLLLWGCAFWGLTDVPIINRIPGDQPYYGSRYISFYEDYLVVSGETVRIFDISDIMSPVLAGSRDAGSMSEIVVSDDYLWTGQEILDISNPEEIVVQSSLSGHGGAAAWSEGFLFTGALSIIDTADPRSPVLASETAVFSLSDFVLQDDHAFLAGGFGLIVLDVTDKAAPVVQSRVSNPTSSDPEDPIRRRRIALSGDTAYISDWNGQLFGVIDVTDKQNPVDIPMNPLPFSADEISALTAAGSRLYIAYRGFAFTSSLAVFDISEPRNPKLEKTIQFNENKYQINIVTSTITDIAVHNQMVFLALSPTGDVLIIPEN